MNQKTGGGGGGERERERRTEEKRDGTKTPYVLQNTTLTWTHMDTQIRLTSPMHVAAKHTGGRVKVLFFDSFLIIILINHLVSKTSQNSENCPRLHTDLKPFFGLH